MSDAMNDVTSKELSQQPQSVVFMMIRAVFALPLWAQVRSVRINQRLRVF